MEIDFELIKEILETVEGVDVVESFLILSMAAFDFAVVSRGTRPDGFMHDSKAGGSGFEEGELGGEFRTEAVGELAAVIGLDAADGYSVFPVKGDGFDEKNSG